MKSLTDRDMLRAAERALEAHLASRPASRSEAQQLADEFRAAATRHIRSAEALEGCAPPTADAFGRGPWVPDERSAANRAHTRDLQEAGRLRQMAVKATGKAEAWDLVAGGPEGAAWEMTRAEYQARVDYYRGLIEAREAHAAAAWDAAQEVLS